MSKFKSFKDKLGQLSDSVSGSTSGWREKYEPLKKSRKYNKEQLLVLMTNLKAGGDSDPVADPKYTADTMKEIFVWQKNGVSLPEIFTNLDTLFNGKAYKLSQALSVAVKETDNTINQETFKIMDKIIALSIHGESIGTAYNIAKRNDLDYMEIFNIVSNTDHMSYSLSISEQKAKSLGISILAMMRAGANIDETKMYKAREVADHFKVKLESVFNFGLSDKLLTRYDKWLSSNVHYFNIAIENPSRFSDDQLKEITRGVEAGYTTSTFAKKEYKPWQIHSIVEYLFATGKDLSKIEYFNEYDSAQLSQIISALKNNEDIETWARPNITAEGMKNRRMAGATDMVPHTLHSHIPPSGIMCSCGDTFMSSALFQAHRRNKQLS